MKKNIIIVIILFLFVLITSGIIYLNNVYLPTKIKSQFTGTLETSLGLNAEIEKIKFSLVRGLIIQNISIYDKTKDKENMFLNIKEIHFNFLFIPLIKERKIIIPIIHIDSPYIYVRYKKDDTFNFSKISALKLKPAPKQKIKFSFFVYKINIFNGKCVFEDEHPEPLFTKTVEDFGAGLSISPFGKISFLLRGKLALDKNSYAKLLAQGEYILATGEMKSQLEFANLSVPEFNPYLEKLPFAVESAKIDTAEFELGLKDKLVSLKGIGRLKNITLKKEKIVLTGDADAEPDFKYALDKKEFDYKTNVKCIELDLSGLPYIEKISGISGDINLTKDKISSDNLKFRALDSVFTANAILEKFAKPFLKADIGCAELNLEKAFLAFLHPEGLQLSGTSKANINIAGNLNKMPLDIKTELDITEARFRLPLLKELINNIKGKLNITSDALNWQRLSFNYNNINYETSGKLLDFKAPRINFGLASKDLDLKSDIKIKDKLIMINTFNGKYLDSKFYLKGDINTQDTANPLFDLNARLNVNIADASVFLPSGLKENIQKMKLGGNLNIAGSLAGKAKDFRDWNLALKTSSDSVSLYNLKFDNLFFNLRQKDRLLSILPFNAAAYAGAIKMQFNSDLKEAIPRYALKLNAQGVDIAKLKSDTGIKDKDIAGILDIDAELYGDFKDAANLKGAALVSVAEGKLWQLNLLKGLGDFVFLPEYEKIIFKEATGRLNIENKFIFTEDLQLKSEPLKLNCKGKMGFDGVLDLTVYNEVNKDLIKDSADIRKFAAAILGQLSNSIVVKISGTIQKPKYSIVPLPVNIIKSIKDFLLGK